MAEINACRVSCTKHAHGAYGSRDYSCHQEVDTTALPHVFASAKHFHAKNLEGEHADLQSKYAGNLAQIMISKRHKDILDVSDPSFVIPTHIESQRLIVEQKGN